MKVAILGSGIIGLSSAYFLAKEGAKVTVFDRLNADNQNCSTGNGGMIVPSHFVPLASPEMLRLGIRLALRAGSPFGFEWGWNPGLATWVRLFLKSANERHVANAEMLLLDMHRESKHIYLDWSTRFDAQFAINQLGLLHLCATQTGWNDELRFADYAQKRGFGIELFEADKLRNLEPNHRIQAVGAARFVEDACFDPAAVVRSLRKECRNLGVQFADTTPVLSGTGMLQADEQEQSIDFIVLACGYETETVVKPLGVRLPLQGGKGFSIDLPTATSPLSHCAILKEARVAITPIGGATRVAATLAITKNPRGYSRQRFQEAVRATQNVLTQLPSPTTEKVWTGMRPLSPDGLPYIGRLTRHPHILVATGHAMMGMSLGPVTGKIIAELIAGRTTEKRAFHPERFA